MVRDKNTPSFAATVESSRIVFKDKDAFARWMRTFKEGEEACVTVSRRKRGRSLKQNGWLWGCVYPMIAEETGHACEELHEIYKRMFLPKRIIKYGDREFPVPGSTASLTTAEFSEYCERVRAEAATLGLNIPDPE